MATMNAQTGAPTEPDPSRWLTETRRSEIIAQFASSRRLLQQGGLWRVTLGYWVRWQASLDAEWSKEDEDDCLALLKKQWHEKHAGNSNIDDELLLQKLRVTPAVERWSRDQWNHRLDSLFLQCKDQLDRASCRFLRVREKRIASELYYRIKAGETTFANAANEFSEGPERNNGGFIPLQPLKSIPFGLAPLLQHLETGKLSQPLRLGKGYCLVELVEFKSSSLNEDIETLLLAEQLRLWIDSVVDVLDSDLEWE